MKRVKTNCVMCRGGYGSLGKCSGAEKVIRRSLTLFYSCPHGIWGYFQHQVKPSERVGMGQWGYMPGLGELTEGAAWPISFCLTHPHSPMWCPERGKRASGVMCQVACEKGTPAWLSSPPPITVVIRVSWVSER